MSEGQLDPVGGAKLGQTRPGGGRGQRSCARLEHEPAPAGGQARTCRAAQLQQRRLLIPRLAFARNPGHFKSGTFAETLPSLTFQNNNNVKDNQLLAGCIPVALPWLSVCPTSAASPHLTYANPWGQPETIPCLQATRSSPASFHRHITVMVSLKDMEMSCPAPWHLPPSANPAAIPRELRVGLARTGFHPDPGVWRAQSFFSAARVILQQKPPQIDRYIYRTQHTDRG